MGRKKTHEERELSHLFLKAFVNDIKRNGIAYIKSATVAKKVKAFDPDIQIVWSSEDRTYTAYYNK